MNCGRLIAVASSVPGFQSFQGLPGSGAKQYSHGETLPQNWCPDKKRPRSRDFLAKHIAADVLERTAEGI